MEVVAVIEVPRGSRNKYEADHETGTIWLDRMLFTATQYPTDYGYIPDTLSEDGDPLDVLVLLDEPTFPRCHIRARPIGVLRMRDEILHFFSVYKQLEPGKSTEPGHWEDHDSAAAVIEQARARHG